MNQSQRKYIENRVLSIARDKQVNRYRNKEQLDCQLPPEPKAPASYVKAMKKWKKDCEKVYAQNEQRNKDLKNKARSIIDEIYLGDETKALEMIKQFEQE